MVTTRPALRKRGQTSSFITDLDSSHWSQPQQTKRKQQDHGHANRHLGHTNRHLQHTDGAPTPAGERPHLRARSPPRPPEPPGPATSRLPPGLPPQPAALLAQPSPPMPLRAPRQGLVAPAHSRATPGPPQAPPRLRDPSPGLTPHSPSRGPSPGLTTDDPSRPGTPRYLTGGGSCRRPRPSHRGSATYDARAAHRHLPRT